MIECHKCHKKVNWLEQLKEWDKEYGEDWVGEAMVAIICEHCGSYVLMIELFEAEDGEDVEAKGLEGKKVKMPKIRSNHEHAKSN